MYLYINFFKYFFYVRKTVLGTIIFMDVDLFRNVLILLLQLLNEVRGQQTYNLMDETGTPPNTVFTMSVEVDGRTFVGEGRSKKDAKKRAAMKVLGELHHIQYPGN